jgi:pectate lyase
LSSPPESLASLASLALLGMMAAAGCWSGSGASPVDADPYGLCPPAMGGGGLGGGVPETVVSCDVAPDPSPLVGWAAVPGSGSGNVAIDTTTGGGEGTPVVAVATLGDLNAALMGSTPAVVQVVGTITGTVRIGSNKTLLGTCGAEILGHVQISSAFNVIVRNLKIVGYNCQDPEALSSRDCSAGPDAVTISGAHHVWFDHDDISDGSDGNLDINQGADNITISWTKFYYSGPRVDPAGAAGGHEFSDLIGSSDGAGDTDSGHLRVTFHHDWWGANSSERMPRVRFGQIHLFNNFWTSAGDSYCVGLGVSANILVEKNIFRKVHDPFNITSYSDANSVLESRGNYFEATTGNTSDKGGPAATPPYDYVAEDPCTVPDAVTILAGPH